MSLIYDLFCVFSPWCTWRDVQHITVHAARIPSIDITWTLNGAGFHVNSKFGFGVMDCSRMVEICQSWKTVPEQHVCETDFIEVERYIEC